MRLDKIPNYVNEMQTQRTRVGIGCMRKKYYSHPSQRRQYLEALWCWSNDEYKYSYRVRADLTDVRSLSLICDRRLRVPEEPVSIGN